MCPGVRDASPGLVCSPCLVSLPSVHVALGFLFLELGRAVMGRCERRTHMCPEKAAPEKYMQGLDVTQSFMSPLLIRKKFTSSKTSSAGLSWPTRAILSGGLFYLYKADWGRCRNGLSVGRSQQENLPSFIGH